MKSIPLMILWRPMADLPVWSKVLADTHYVLYNNCDGGCRVVHTQDKGLAREWPGFRAGYDAWAVLPTPDSRIKLVA
jgi:hypothetical protein